MHHATSFSIAGLSGDELSLDLSHLFQRGAAGTDAAGTNAAGTNVATCDITVLHLAKAVERALRLSFRWPYMTIFDLSRSSLPPGRPPRLVKTTEDVAADMGEDPEDPEVLRLTDVVIPAGTTLFENLALEDLRWGYHETAQLKDRYLLDRGSPDASPGRRACLFSRDGDAPENQFVDDVRAYDPEVDVWNLTLVNASELQSVVFTREVVLAAAPRSGTPATQIGRYFLAFNPQLFEAALLGAAFVPNQWWRTGDAGDVFRYVMSNFSRLPVLARALVGSVGGEALKDLKISLPYDPWGGSGGGGGEQGAAFFRGTARPALMLWEWDLCNGRRQEGAISTGIGILEFLIGEPRRRPGGSPPRAASGARGEEQSGSSSSGGGSGGSGFRGGGAAGANGSRSFHKRADKKTPRQGGGRPFSSFDKAAEDRFLALRTLFDRADAAEIVSAAAAVGWLGESGPFGGNGVNRRPRWQPAILHAASFVRFDPTSTTLVQRMLDLYPNLGDRVLADPEFIQNLLVGYGCALARQLCSVNCSTRTREEEHCSSSSSRVVDQFPGGGAQLGAACNNTTDHVEEERQYQKIFALLTRQARVAGIRYHIAQTGHSRVQLASVATFLRMKLRDDWDGPVTGAQVIRLGAPDPQQVAAAAEVEGGGGKGISIDASSSCCSASTEGTDLFCGKLFGGDLGSAADAGASTSGDADESFANTTAFWSRVRYASISACPALGLVFDGMIAGFSSSLAPSSVSSSPQLISESEQLPADGPASAPRGATSSRPTTAASLLSPDQIIDCLSFFWGQYAQDLLRGHSKTLWRAVMGAITKTSTGQPHVVDPATSILDGFSNTLAKLDVEVGGMVVVPRGGEGGMRREGGRTSVLARGAAGGGGGRSGGGGVGRSEERRGLGAEAAALGGG